MDEREKKIKKIEQFLKEAKNIIHSAEQVLRTLAAEEKGGKISNNKDSGVEGVFDGVKIVDVNGQVYDVPENYASKSKLIKGDVLKMTLGSDGNNLFKPISKTGRKKVQGKVINEGNFYKVLVEGKSYKITKSAVDFFRLGDNDEAEIIIPLEGESEWAAVEKKISGADPTVETVPDLVPENKISETITEEKEPTKSELEVKLESQENVTQEAVLPDTSSVEDIVSSEKISTIPESSPATNTIVPPENNISGVVAEATPVSGDVSKEIVSESAQDMANIEIIENKDDAPSKIHDLKIDTANIPLPTQDANKPEIPKEKVIETLEPQKTEQEKQNYNLDSEEEEVVYQEDHNDSGELSTFHNQEQNQSADQELAKDILDRPSNNAVSASTENGSVGQGVKELDI